VVSQYKFSLHNSALLVHFVYSCLQV